MCIRRLLSVSSHIALQKTKKTYQIIQQSCKTVEDLRPSVESLTTSPESSLVVGMSAAKKVAHARAATSQAAQSSGISAFIDVPRKVESAPFSPPKNQSRSVEASPHKIIRKSIPKNKTVQSNSVISVQDQLDPQDPTFDESFYRPPALQIGTSNPSIDEIAHSPRNRANNNERACTNFIIHKKLSRHRPLFPQQQIVKNR